MLPAIAVLLAIVLFALVIMPKRSPSASTLLSGVVDVGPARPVASGWSKQMAAEMLDEIAVADERAKVLETLQRAVDENKTPKPKSAK